MGLCEEQVVRVELAMGLVLLAEISVDVAHCCCGRGKGWVWDRDVKTTHICCVFAAWAGS